MSLLKKYSGKFFILTLLAILFVSIAPVQTVKAAIASDFMAGNIINDSIFFNNNAMSVLQIQAFMNAKVPTCDTNGTQIYSGTETRAQYGAAHGYPAPYTCLENYTQSTQNVAAVPGICSAYSGSTQSSAQIIYNVSQACGINPQVLLVLLQKEESLVTDDWPWPSEYQTATGFGCPDTAACNSTYYGFFNQVYNAARIYRVYAADASSYNYVAGRNNNILYNPSSSCGSSSIYLQNQATTGLYNYTPYQPDAAALANLYGTGDSCSSYGNRNFFRDFYDWFGSTTGGVSLIKSSDSATVYALYGGEIQGIPSQDVLNAWGLQSLPITVTDDASLAVFPNRGVLTRVAVNPYNSSLYLLADNGGTYDALSNMVSDWGYNPAGASNVGTELIAFTTRLGGLSEFVTSPGSGAIYTVDNGSARAFSTPDNYQSWAGGSTVNSISSALLSDLTSGTGITSNQAQTATNQYVMDSGNLLSLDSNTSQLYPRTNVLTISSNLVNVLNNGGPASRFVKGSDGTIYLVDGGTKHGIASLGLLNSYTTSPNTSVTVFSDSELAQIPDGNTITTRFVYNTNDSTKQYYVDGNLYSLTPNFVDSAYGFAMSPTGLGLIGSTNTPISCGQGLIQAQGTPGIYILDNGAKRGVASPDMLNLINNGSGNICILNPEDVNAIPTGSPISPYVSNNGINYVTEQNTALSVSPSVATSIGATSFTPVSAAYLADYSTGTALTSTFKAGENFVFTDSGKYYPTTSSTIAGLWGINSSAMSVSPYLLSFISYGGGSLIPFARPTDTTNSTIYLVDNDKFLPIIALDHLFNAGYAMQTIPTISLSYINAKLGNSWQGYLAKDASSGTIYVLEGGKKHVVSTTVQPNWLGTTSPLSPTTLSTSFLSLLTNGPAITTSVETGAPGIYAVTNGYKAGIPNIATYNALYAPDVVVTPQLIDSIPNGPAISPL